MTRGPRYIYTVQLATANYEVVLLHREFVGICRDRKKQQWLRRECMALERKRLKS